jgi:hypothetical protein
MTQVKMRKGWECTTHLFFKTTPLPLSLPCGMDRGFSLNKGLTDSTSFSRPQLWALTGEEKKISLSRKEDRNK